MNVLLIYIFLDVIAFSSIIISVLPFHAKMLGAGPFLVTLYISTFSFIQFFASPILGKLSDKFGRKPLLVTSSFADLFSHLVMAFANTLPLLFLSRLIAGLFSCNISVGSAFVSDQTSSEERTKYVGRFNSAYSLGFAIGPLIGGFLAGSNSLSPNYFNTSIFAATINIINIFILIFFLRPSRSKITSKSKSEKKKSLFLLLKNKNLAYLFILYFSVNFVFSGLNGIFALWSEARFNWGPQQIGIMMSFVGILLAFHQSISINLFIKKLKEKKTIFISIIFIFIGIYTLTISFNYWMLSIAIFFCTMGIGVLNPTINSLVSINTNKNQTGSALSINQSGLSIARFTGQPFSGFFFQNFSINTPLFIGLFILLIIQIIYSKKLNKD